MSNDFDLRAHTQSLANPGVKDVRSMDDGSLVAASRYTELAARGKVFSASAAAVTLPVNANNLVSLFGVYNPPGSGVMLELIEAEAHYVVATTVVNALGLYASTIALSGAATFTTQGSVQANRLNEGQAANARFYSAVTHSGTPTLIDIIGGWGAVTDGGATPIRKQWNGIIQVTPGTLISLAMTTAAATTSGVTLALRWAEVPYTAQ